jgi:hypothetical protein
MGYDAIMAIKCCGYIKLLCDPHYSEGLTFENHIRRRGGGNEGWPTSLTEAWSI